MPRVSPLRSLGCLAAAGTFLAAFAPAAQSASGPTVTVASLVGHGAGTVAVAGRLSCAQQEKVTMDVRYEQVEGNKAKGAVENTSYSCGPESQDWTATVPITGWAVPGRHAKVQLTLTAPDGSVLLDRSVTATTGWDTAPETKGWESYIRQVTAEGRNAGLGLLLTCPKGGRFSITLEAHSTTGASGTDQSPEITCPGVISVSPKALGKPGNPDFRPRVDTTATVTVTSSGVEVSKRTLTMPAGY